jgi:hypothetical protein
MTASAVKPTTPEALEVSNEHAAGDEKPADRTIAKVAAAVDVPAADTQAAPPVANAIAAEAERTRATTEVVEAKTAPPLPADPAAPEPDGPVASDDVAQPEPVAAAPRQVGSASENTAPVEPVEAPAAAAVPTPGERAASASTSASTISDATVVAGNTTAVPAAETVQRETRQAAAPYKIIDVEPGNSLSDLMIAVYGQYSNNMVRRVQALNPQITDPNMILAGDSLRFPADGKPAYDSEGQPR